MFKKQIGRDIYWVHPEVLGKCTIALDTFSKPIYSPIDMVHIRSLTHSLADAIKIFESIGYSIADDTTVIDEDGIQWEHHAPVSQMICTKKGSCATAAAWLVQALIGKYDSVSMLLIFRDNQTGHVINVIEQNNNYYFVDMYMHMLDNLQYLCPQTGLLSDFVKQKYITSVIYMAESLESFALFYSRFLKKRIQEHIYIQLNSDVVAPIASDCVDGKVTLYVPIENVRKVISDNINMTWIGYLHPAKSIKY